MSQTGPRAVGTYLRGITYGWSHEEEFVGRAREYEILNSRRPHMAQKPSKRWVAEVEAHCLRLTRYGRILDGPAMLRSEAATLLSRQHASFVRLVKKAYTHSPNFRGGMVPCEDGEWVNVKDLLAALQQGGKK